jgi:hypothetical protein
LTRRIQAATRDRTLINPDHVLALSAAHTPAHPLPARIPQEARHVSATTVPRADSPAHEEAPEEARGTSLVEAILDNLSAWTVIAAAIAFLYLVWATVEILSRYVGPLPKVGV